MPGNANEQLTETVRTQAERRADAARQELGEMAIDATGRYFPEAVQRRRRRDMALGFAVGLLVGMLAWSAAGR